MAFALIAVLASIVFVRLGFWQLDRHAEKRDTAELREARLSEPPLPLSTLLELADDGGTVEDVEWRRVMLRGRWDPAGEVLIRSRVRRSRPGVHVVTPLAPDSSDAISREETPAELLVLRGWLPAPDAMSPGSIAPPEDPPIAGEGRLVGAVRASRDGAGEPMLPSGEGDARRPTFAAVDVQAIEEHAPDLVAYLPVFVQLLPDEAEGETGSAPGEPIRVPLPEPGTGTHLAYAVQWFLFAVIALVGTGAYLFQQRRQPRGQGVREGPSPG